MATSYDKLASNYLVSVQVASMRLWLRVNESTPLNISAASWAAVAGRWPKTP